jgi:hypothetical protein
VGLSGGGLVLVRESAEDLFSADPVVGEVDRLRRPGVSLTRCELAEGTVRPGGVVMQQVLGQHLAQVVLIDDQQPAGKLPAQGTDDPFADGVRSWCLRRAGQNPDAARQEDGVEAGGELAGAVPDQEFDSSRARAGSIRKLRAAWAVHARSGFAVIPARQARRVPCSMTISG